MKDFKFKYCVCEKKHVFDENIKKSKLFVDKNTSIKIEYDDDNILIGINDIHKFIEFVMDNKLICKKLVKKHGRYYTHFDEYLDYIFKNNLLDHIKSPIIKRYIKFMKSCHRNYYNGIKYSDIISKAFKYSSFETIKVATKLATINNHEHVIICVCKRNGEDFFEIFKYVTDLYCKNLMNYVHDTTKHDHYEIDYYVLEILAYTDNLQAFNYFIDQVESIFNDIDDREIKPEYSQEIKNKLLCSCIINQKLVIANQLILDGADVAIINKRIIDYLFEDASVNSIDFIIEKGLLDKHQINERFKMSYHYEVKVAEVLVSNGADYELYIDKLMKKTKNYPNKDFYNYLKELKNQ
ncbi:hypothetical protein QLL95_gp0469 [Cotonvirus japonicus]|uniref:Ankyrin repeat protein n=1 Tax=Cotonvirus japonicus TaxID=2811091 RepID=A0ABM7NU01_9VIRU|nr:hypothetical protein QLL95_gp0469 [Cotonvirus japonicus]BCS83654.1 hypothetical protein [Cotonvirus japonicus]